MPLTISIQLFLHLYIHGCCIESITFLPQAKSSIEFSILPSLFTGLLTFLYMTFMSTRTHTCTHACISTHSVTTCMAYTQFCKEVLNSLVDMPPPHPSPSSPFGPYLSLSATKMTLRSNSNDAKIRISWRTLRQVKRHSKSTCSSRESMGRRSSNTCMKGRQWQKPLGESPKLHTQLLAAFLSSKVL